MRPARLKPIPLFLLLAALSVLLTGCGEEGVYAGKLLAGGDISIRSGQTETAAVLLLEGQIEIEEGGALTGDIYQFGGSTQIDGRVEGNISHFNGDLVIGPQAEIIGDVLLGGEGAEIDPGARISGEVTESASQLPDEERLNAFSDVSPGWRIAQVVLLTVLAAVISKSMPAPLRRVAAALSDYLVPSMAMGLLVFIVGLSLVVQMMFTVILIPVSILGLVLLAAAALFGWIGAAHLLGRWLGKVVKRPLGKTWQTALGMAVLMALQQVLAGLPVPGAGLVFILISVAGLGAVSLTRFGLQRFEPAFDEDDLALEGE